MPTKRKDMDMNKPTIKIRDLGLAAALVSSGFEVREIEQVMGGQAYFVFARTTELSHALTSYWEDTLDIKARRYFDNIKMLKSRIYSDR